MFNTNNGAPSLSDIAAVTGNNDFGGNNGWWILILLFAIFGGWGNGYGYNRDNAQNVQDGYVLASDFANIERKIDGVNNGLCDGFYAQNTNILNGFSNTNAAIANGFAGVNNGICTLGYQNAQLINGLGTQLMQSVNTLQAGQNALGYQLQQACCDNREAISQVRYDLTQQAQMIMQNDNNNYRALHDEIVANQIAAKDARIAEQAAQIQALNLAASQQAQNAYLLSQLKPSCTCPSC